MKKFLFLAVLSFIGYKASAQQFNAADFSKQLGKTGTLCDTVKSLRIVNDTLTLLNMGGVYPHQKYTVAVKGNKITLDWANLKGKNICATGVFELFKNQPQVTVAQPNMIEVH
ncbi:MAG: hypothetical protein ABI367_07620 [Mucilaginibacter sp.]